MDCISVTYRDRAVALRAIGVLMLTAGIFLAVLAPLELLCIPWFMEGGRFHYEGFGPGSFMFAFIIAQVVVYAVLAAFLILLGYAHIKQRIWAASLSRACLWAWLLIGLPVLPMLFFLVLAQKEMGAATAVALAAMFCAAYFVLPALFIRFYAGRNVTLTLGARDGAGGGRLFQASVRTLTAAVLFIYLGVVCIILLLFGGLYPAFGALVTGMPGAAALCIAALLCVALAWARFRGFCWARWGSALLAGLMAATCIITFSSNGYPELLAKLALPARELDAFRGLPLQGWHFAVLTALPFLAGFGVSIVPDKK